MQIKLSENIRNLRKLNHMTQEELAERLNVSLGVVSKWERGASEPELSSLVAIAEVFKVSVDALIGYEMSDESPEMIIETVRRLKNQMRITEAIDVVSDALLKFPNNLKIVYNAAELFKVTKFAGCGDYFDRAITLFNKAVTLLTQDDKNEFSEIEIKNEIAFCLLQQNRIDEAIEVLAANNVGNINDDMLAMIYINYKKDYEQGMHHLADSLPLLINKFIRVVSGFANAYAYTNRLDKAAQVSDMFDEVTKAFTIDPQVGTFLDKVNAVFQGGAGYWSMARHDEEGARRYFQKAYEYAAKYDANPVHNCDNVLLAGEITQESAVFDDIGVSAMDAVESVIAEEKDNGAMKLWKEIKQNKGRDKK